MSSNEAESQVLDDIHKLPFADQTHIPFGSLNSVAPFVSSPISVLRRAHSMLEITNRDIVFDLGCGTGDFLLFAADQANCKAVGIDIDHDVVWEGRKRADDLGLAHLIEFRISDVFEDDDWVQEATKIFVYLVPRMLAKKKLRNKFARFLSQSNRKVICYYFALPDWEPDHVDSQLNLYLYEKPYQGYLE
jgi:SAM-dependent methyltransferase